MRLLSSKQWPRIQELLALASGKYVYDQAAIALIDIAFKTLEAWPDKEFSSHLVRVAKIYSETYNPLVLYFLFEGKPLLAAGSKISIGEIKELIFSLFDSIKENSSVQKSEIFLLHHILETNMMKKSIITDSLINAIKFGNGFAQMIYASIQVVNDFDNSFESVKESAINGHGFAALEYVVEYFKSHQFKTSNAEQELQPILNPLVNFGHPVAILDRALTGKARSLMYLAAYYENWQACSIIKSDPTYCASDELINIQTEIKEYENKLAVNRALLLQSTLTWHWRELGLIQ